MHIRRKKIIIIFAVIAFFALGALFIRKISSKNNSSSVSKKAFVGDISVVVRLSGSVQPRNRLEIRPQISGRIEQILVSEGHRVRKGEIIGWLSSADRAALMDAARAKGQEEFQKWEDAYKPSPIVAPIDGFIILRDRETGQTVNPSDVILVMADRLIVRADVDETDLKYIKKSGKVRITLDAYAESIFQGVIEHIGYESRLINNVTVYEVEILPLKVPEIFRAGMTAAVELTAAESKNALLVPFDAVKQLRGKSVVNILTPKSEKVSREVTTGITDGKNIEIISGIAEGEKILIQVEEEKSHPRMSSPAGGMGFMRR